MSLGEEEIWTQAEGRPVRTQRKDGHLQAKEKGHNVRLLAPRTVQQYICVVRPPSLCKIAVAALANYHAALPGTNFATPTERELGTVGVFVGLDHCCIPSV